MVKSALENELVFHISRDSTAIESREKVEVKSKGDTSLATPKRSRGAKEGRNRFTERADAARAATAFAAPESSKNE